MREIDAVICREYGPPEVVEMARIPSVPVTDGQIGIAVRAASVNYPDVLLIADDYQINVPTPFVPGSECAGEVIELSGRRSAPALGRTRQ